MTTYCYADITEVCGIAYTLYPRDHPYRAKKIIISLYNNKKNKTPVLILHRQNQTLYRIHSLTGKRLQTISHSHNQKHGTAFNAKSREEIFQNTDHGSLKNEDLHSVNLNDLITAIQKRCDMRHLRTSLTKEKNTKAHK